jgi:hypothetical protein
VLVVWEPVIATDLAPPTTGTLARIHDKRAAQYWDQEWALSEEIVRSVRAAPERYGWMEELDVGSIVWDTVLLFPPQARWERDFPVPDDHGAPAVSSARGLADALARAHELESDPSRP